MRNRKGLLSYNLAFYFRNFSIESICHVDTNAFAKESCVNNSLDFRIKIVYLVFHSLRSAQFLFNSFLEILIVATKAKLNSFNSRNQKRPPRGQLLFASIVLIRPYMFNFCDCWLFVCRGHRIVAGTATKLIVFRLSAAVSVCVGGLVELPNGVMFHIRRRSSCWKWFKIFWVFPLWCLNRVMNVQKIIYNTSLDSKYGFIRLVIPDLPCAK